MPVSLPSLSAAVVCDGKELETYNVEQESASFSKAFIASEAGKVSVFSPLGTGRSLQTPLSQSFHDSAIQNHFLQQFGRL